MRPGGYKAATSESSLAMSRLSWTKASASTPNALRGTKSCASIALLRYFGYLHRLGAGATEDNGLCGSSADAREGAGPCLSRQARKAMIRPSRTVTTV